MRNSNNEEYYRSIVNLNISHYTGEIPFYSTAPLRSPEERLLRQLPSHSKILDLGCGSGRFSINAAKIGFTVVGLDITPQAVTAASQRVSGELNVKFVVGDMSEIPFPDDSFDYVFCPRFSINALATFERRKKAIEEMLRVVRPGGKVFIESFNRWYLGKGPVVFVINQIRFCAQSINFFFSKFFRLQYHGLFPGDITYKANKVEGAPIGYAHLPTVREIQSWVPRSVHRRLYSIPQIIGSKRTDFWKYFRYSIWMILKND